MASIAIRPRYAASSRRLHWATFVLVAAAYLLINLFGMFPRGSTGRVAMLNWHAVTGLGVLLLVLPRVWLRTRHLPPPITPPAGRWAHALSATTHLALYAFLLIQPLLGLITLQIKGTPVGLFGTTLLPSFVDAPDRVLAHRFEDVHSTLGTIFYWVIGLHILAALWHHYIRRDDTLKRML